MPEALIAVAAAFVGAGITGCLSAMAGQLYERRKWERRLLREAGITPGPANSHDRPATSSPSQFDRLEQAVEAMAVEIERVSEGQRFVTRLLAERRSHQTPPSPSLTGISNRP